MAEMGVDFALDKLSSLLRHEAEFPRATHSDIKTIKQCREAIALITKNPRSSTFAKVWAEKALDSAHFMEDVIDELMLPSSRHLDKRGIHCFRGKTKDGIDIVSSIRSIRESLSEIKELAERYGIQSLQPSNDHDEVSPLTVRNVQFRFRLDADLAGTDAPNERLITLLQKEGQKRMVIAVFGPEGIGKTNITRKVYNSMKKLNYFDCQVWISVGSLSQEELLWEILEELVFAKTDNLGSEDFGSFDKSALIDKISALLLDKRYLIVFDNVEMMDSRDMDMLVLALPQNQKGSKIMIATRRKEVANPFEASAEVQEHELKPLQKEEAKDLFCRIARISRVDAPELSNLVNKCRGIPLAIVSIAYLLSGKGMDHFEWRRLHKNFDSVVYNNPTNLIHSQGYMDLAYNLMQCLLYFGLFPVDYSIRPSKLIRLWVAEGFVSETLSAPDITRLEDVARELLNELKTRSLVELDSGRCRIQHLLHKLMVSKSRDVKFNRANGSETEWNINSQSRRLSVYSNVEAVVSGILDSNRVRSCFLFDIKEFSKDLLMKFISKFKLLKVLSFENAPISVLPKDISQLVMLKYLSIRNTSVETLPESIGRLGQLQTLDVKHSLVKRLPDEISKLTNLRHLFGCHQSGEGVKVNQGIGKLISLKTLKVVDASDQVIKEMDKLNHLQKLGITNVTKEKGRTLCFAIEKMNHLLSLNISIHNLNKVDELYFHQGWLKKLSILRLSNMLRLKNLRIDEGALPSLEVLSIGQCPKLVEVPTDIQHLQNLKTTIVIGMPDEFINKMKRMTHVENIVVMDGSDKNQRSEHDSKHHAYYIQWNKAKDENFGLRRHFPDDDYNLFWEGFVGKKEKHETSSVPSNFSSSKCVAALNQLENISDDMYGKALEKFLIREWRDMFLSMPPNRRKTWVERLAEGNK